MIKFACQYLEICSLSYRISSLCYNTLIFEKYGKQFVNCNKSLKFKNFIYFYHLTFLKEITETQEFF